MSNGYREFGLLQRKVGVAGGTPCLSRSGIRVEMLAGRFGAGESIADIAADYGRTSEEVEAAIRLVIVARGVNLDEKRASVKVAAHVPLLK